MNIASALRKLTKPMIIAANKMDIPIAQENYIRIKFEHPDKHKNGKNNGDNR